MNAEAKISRVLIHAAMVSNMILGGVIFMRLQITPADVMTEMRVAFDTVNTRNLAAEKRLDNLEAVVQARTEWMKSVDGILSEHTREHLFRAEFRNWCEDVRERNGDKMLDIPEISETPTP